MSGAAPSGALEIELPGWVNEVVDWSSGYPDDEARMRLAIALSRENVDRRTGGPFAAAVFESDTGALVAVGAAGRADASALAFDEGPVFPESYAYLERRGLAVERGVLRAEAVAVLSLVASAGD